MGRACAHVLQAGVSTFPFVMIRDPNINCGYNPFSMLPNTLRKCKNKHRLNKLREKGPHLFMLICRFQSSPSVGSIPVHSLAPVVLKSA